jgi:hypothetical protein
MTHPPAGPSTPPPHPGPKAPAGRLADELDSAALLLQTIGVLRLPGMDPALKMQLNSGLRTARRAVAAAQSPARRDHEAAAVAPAIATTGGPSVACPQAAARTGGPLAPGAGDTFSPPRRVGLPRFDIGVGPLYDALPGLNASLARRAD